MRSIAAIVRPFIAGALLAAAMFPSTATAAPGKEAWMIRMMACEGDSAKMELYLPQSAVEGAGMQAGQTVIGYYALDLSDANKGKPLEPVRVTMSADKKSVTVD